MDLTDMKLGDYVSGRRAVWVTCDEDEDPREAMRPRMPPVPRKPQLERKQRRTTKRDAKGEQ